MRLRNNLKNPTETLELKNIMNKMKNEIESINSRMDQAEERICELKDRLFENVQTEKK